MAFGRRWVEAFSFKNSNIYISLYIKTLVSSTVQGPAMSFPDYMRVAT
uniref:Uncharacterized protein n=1 Tax=Arundo donax TaxID=35708 RepID=A0A0A8ZH42_ARUDO